MFNFVVREDRNAYSFFYSLNPELVDVRRDLRISFHLKAMILLRREFICLLLGSFLPFIKSFLIIVIISVQQHHRGIITYNTTVKKK